MNNESLKDIYRKNLKHLKEVLNKSVSEMAKDTGISASTLNSYFNGERTASLDAAAKLYLAYNINLAWFCTGIGSMFLSNPSETAGARLALILKKHSLTIDMASNLLNIPKNNLNAVVNNQQQFDINLLTALKQKLNVSSDYLLYGE